MNEKITGNPLLNRPVKWYGYVALVLGILFFSGLLDNFLGGVLDFNTLLGTFGKLGKLTEGSGSLASNFVGTGGDGAKNALMQSISCWPAVMLALAIISVIEHYDGLAAAQRLLTPILKPLLGISGSAGLALVGSLQSADAGAAMTNEIYNLQLISEKERNIFTAFQFTGGACITNMLLIGAVFLPVISNIGMKIGIPFIVVFCGKILSANIVRFLEGRWEKKALKASEK